MKNQRLLGKWNDGWRGGPRLSQNEFRQWREKQKDILKERDEEAQQKKQDTIQKAHEDIDKFYEDYNEKKQKAIEEHR